MEAKIARLFILGALVQGWLAMPAHAGDPIAGKRKAAQACQTCHGLNGIGTMPMVANIAGQQELYIIAQLQAYRSGKRRHEQMSIIARMLSPADIENVAAWYSAISVTVEMPK